MIEVTVRATPKLCYVGFHYFLRFAHQRIGLSD
jgi:hypothetical protein